MKFKNYLPFIAIFALTPLFVFAQPTDLFGVIDIFFGLIRSLIPLVFSIALLGFLYGAALFILKSDDASEQKKGKDFMIYGIIALFVMVGIWGIVGILGNTFGIETVIPSFPGGSGTVGPGGSLGPGDCYDDVDCLLFWGNQ